MSKDLQKQAEEAIKQAEEALAELEKYNKKYNKTAESGFLNLSEEPPELVDLISVLLAAGYRQYDIGEAFRVKYPFSRQWAFSRRMDFLPLCLCNENSRIHIEIFEMHHEGTIHYSTQMNVCAEMLDTEWCDLKFYNIPLKKLTKHLESFEARLIKAWQAANEGVTPRDRYAEESDDETC
jgi:hypothetical protein